MFIIVLYNYLHGNYSYRVVWTHLGYNLGTKAVATIVEGAERIGKAATILGCTVISALIANYVSINVATFVVVIVCSFFGIL